MPVPIDITNVQKYAQAVQGQGGQPQRLSSTGASHRNKDGQQNLLINNGNSQPMLMQSQQVGGDQNNLNTHRFKALN